MNVGKEVLSLSGLLRGKCVRGEFESKVEIENLHYIIASVNTQLYSILKSRFSSKLKVLT